MEDIKILLACKYSFSRNYNTILLWLSRWEDIGFNAPSVIDAHTITTKVAWFGIYIYGGLCLTLFVTHIYIYIYIYIWNIYAYTEYIFMFSST